MVISRLDILVKGNQIYVDKYIHDWAQDNFLNKGLDHWLIYNDNLKFEVWYPDEDTKQLFYEALTWKNRRRYIYTELNNFHFPYIKQSRADANNERIKSAFTLDEIKQSSLVSTRIDPAMLDKDKILKIYDNFAWDKANYKKS